VRPEARAGSSLAPGRLRAERNHRTVVRSTDRQRPRERVYEWGDNGS